MNAISSFHEVRFPTDLALGATGGPERRTEIVTLGSGREQRNARWANSRRRYNAGYGVKTVADLQRVVEFFEERRGRLYGFRFRDPLDWKSSSAGQPVSPSDQFLGTGDGNGQNFQLLKIYGKGDASYSRQISKPVEGTVQVAVDGAVLPPEFYSVDWTSGAIEIAEAHIPAVGLEVSAGFEFDVPVRFDTDELSVNLRHFEAGDIPSIPLVELLL